MKLFSVIFGNEGDSVVNGASLSSNHKLKLGNEEIPCLGLEKSDICSGKAHRLNAVKRGIHLNIYKDHKKDDSGVLFLVSSLFNAETVVGNQKFFHKRGRNTLVAVEYQPETLVAAIHLPGHNVIFHIKGEERARMLPEKEFNQLIKKAIKDPARALELLRIAA